MHEMQRYAGYKNENINESCWNNGVIEYADNQ